MITKLQHFSRWLALSDEGRFDYLIVHADTFFIEIYPNGKFIAKMYSCPDIFEFDNPSRELLEEIRLYIDTENKHYGDYNA